MRRSFALIWMSTSSASGSTATVAVAVGGELISLPHFPDDGLILAERFDQRFNFRQRLGELPVLRGTALHRGRAEQVQQLLITPFFRSELVKHHVTTLNAKIA